MVGSAAAAAAVAVRTQFRVAACKKNTNECVRAALPLKQGKEHGCLKGGNGIDMNAEEKQSKPSSSESCASSVQRTDRPTGQRGFYSKHRAAGRVVLKFLLVNSRRSLHSSWESNIWRTGSGGIRKVWVMAEACGEPEALESPNPHRVGGLTTCKFKKIK